MSYIQRIHMTLLEKFKAVLFDLDGVLTATEKLHAACWKTMFDEYLLRKSVKEKVPFEPFDIEKDYRTFVDGRPRYEGVRTFLNSRGINLPQGEDNDQGSAETVCGLGNRKNQLIREMLTLRGVEVYAGSEALVRYLSGKMKMAVVSSSKNCSDVLAAAGISQLFDCIVDGNSALNLGLKGKPEPDTFLAAAKMLGVEPDHAVVIEDAVSGITAGHAGGFGLVVGVARHGDMELLRESGADIVVADLSELLNSEGLG